MKRSFTLAAATASLLIPAPALAASIGGFSIRPAHFNARVPATRAYFEPTIAKGHSYTDQVVVTNASSHPASLRVDPVDGLTGVTSGAVYANRQDPLRKAGRWVHAATSLVTVAPRSQESVAFTVSVPSAASAGDHLAGLAFQDAHPRRSAGKFAITEIVRAVVGIEIVVPGPAKPALSLYSLRVKPLPGTTSPSLVIALANTGRQLCKPRLAVTLSGPGRSLRVVRQLDTILPGDDIPYPFSWPRPLGPGSYRASVSATGCGARVSLARTVALEHPLAGTVTNPQAKPAVTRAGMPALLIALVALGGIGVGGLLSVRRRRPAKPTLG